MNNTDSTKNVLVTGACGFIGSFLLPRLISEGYRVVALDMDEKRMQPLKDAGMDVITCDLTRPASLKGVCDGMDVVIHLAAHVKSWGRKKLFYDSIYHATRNLLDEAAGSRRRFIYFSSFCAAGAGGITRHLIGHKEDDPEKRTGASFYCDAKYDAEKLVQEYHARGEINATIIRPANVIGPGSVWVSDMIDTLQNSKKFPVIDGGKYNGCFVYVENLVDGILLTLSRDAAQGRTYHFRDDYHQTWNDYVTDLARIVGKDVQFANLPFSFAWSMGYICDKVLRPLNIKSAVCRHTVGLTGRDNSVDTARAKTELGWETRIPYEDAIGAIEEWVKNVYLQ